METLRNENTSQPLKKKKEGNLPFATTQMKLESWRTLYRVKQARHRKTHYMIFNVGSEKVNS